MPGVGRGSGRPRPAPTPTTKRSSTPLPIHGLSEGAITEIADEVQKALDSTLVLDHAFVIRVEIKERDSSLRASVAVVPRDDRGAGFMVDVRGVLFFDRRATPEIVRSCLERWEHE